MKKHKIIVSPTANRDGMISKISEMLGSIGINTCSGGCMDGKKNFVLTFEGKLSPIQIRLIQLFLTDVRTFASDFEFVQAVEVFDFEDYMNTDLDGVGQAMGMDQELNDVDAIIDNVLAYETPEFKQQARNAVANLWKEKIEDWLLQNKHSA